MAIKSLDALAGAELVRPRAIHPDVRRSTPPTAAVDTAATVSQEAEKAKAEPQKPAQTTALQLETTTSNVLRFQIDKDTGKTVAQLVDTSGQVLRQIPSEEALEVAKALNQYRGMFVDRRV